MNWSVFMRFANLDVLKGISQNLLTRFLEPFTADFAAEGISLPNPSLPDEVYFQGVATLFASPELLPHRLTEALHAVQEMSDPQCRDQINTALAALQSTTLPRQSEAAAGPSLPILHGFSDGRQDSTTPVREVPGSPPEHFAIQAWLALPTLLANLETYTLDPIQAQGQDALAVHGFPPLRKATLRETETVSNNIFHVVTITRADDVFRAARADRDYCDPAPEGATLTHATLDFEFEDCAQHYTVDIRPPNLLNLIPDWHAIIIKRWLTVRGFRGFQKLSHLLVILSLALASAVAPVMDDPDTDDDDDGDDPHRTAHHASRFNDLTLRGCNSFNRATM